MPMECTSCALAKAARSNSTQESGVCERWSLRAWPWWCSKGAQARNGGPWLSRAATGSPFAPPPPWWPSGMQLGLCSYGLWAVGGRTQWLHQRLPRGGLPPILPTRPGAQGIPYNPQPPSVPTLLWDSAENFFLVEARRSPAKSNALKWPDHGHTGVHGELKVTEGHSRRYLQTRSEGESLQKQLHNGPECGLS